MSTQKIALCGKIWRYRAGRVYVVAKNTVTGQSVYAPLNEVVRMSWTMIEQLQHDKSFSVKPSDIVRWLTRLEEK